MADPQSQNTSPSFEEALAQLDAIVESLEEDGVPLTDLVEQYDRGMKLLEACHTKLQEAKQRVTTIARSYRDAAEDSETPDEDANDELF